MKNQALAVVAGVALSCAGAVSGEPLRATDAHRMQQERPDIAGRGPRLTPEQRAELRAEQRAMLDGAPWPRGDARAFRLAMELVRAGVDPMLLMDSPEEYGLGFMADSSAPAPKARMATVESMLESGRHGPAVGRMDLDPPYGYWDGMETYTLEPDPSDNVFTNGVGTQLGCGGVSTTASFYFVAVDEDNPLNAPQIMDDSRDPFMGGALPCMDASPGVQAVLMDGRGSRGVRITGAFLGFRLWTGDGGSPASPVIFAPYDGSPVVVSLDFYFGDLEQYSCWSPSSAFQGCIASRICQSGYSIGDPFAEPDHSVPRPQMLGVVHYSTGRFFTTPRDPAPGLPTFETKVGEWYTVACRIATNGLEWWVKDSGTDGSAGILIDDPGDTPLFESQWAQIFPGCEPGAPVEIGGGVTAWEGYGLAIDEFGGHAQQFFGAFKAIDNAFTIVGGDPDPVMSPDLPYPGWVPTNHFMDNWLIIGESFSIGPQPKERLPFVDDMELYGPGALLQISGFSWNVAFGANPVIDVSANTTPPPGSDGDGMPGQSIRLDNDRVDSLPQPAFAALIPFGAQRPWVAPGCPIEVSANMRCAPTTVYGMFVMDNDIESLSAAVLTGATDAANGDAVDARWHIRLPNPLHDPAAPVSNLARIDDMPDLAQNAPVVNWPTTTSSAAAELDFVSVRLTVFGDGTGEWTIDGQPLVFDPAFYSLDPALEQHLASADLLSGGDGMPPYSRFACDLKTLDEVEFWSGNNTGGLGDSLYVDDLLVDAKTRHPGPGPEFVLPWCDDFECYNVDKPVAEQGLTPFIDESLLSPSSQRVEEAPILAASASGGFDPGTEWATYTVLEAIPALDRKGSPLPDEWGVQVGDVIYIRHPAEDPECDPFVAPAPPAAAGEVNLILSDPMDVLRPCYVRVGPPGNTTSDGSEADFRASFTRHDPGTLFCRYEVVSLTATSNPSMGGAPFECPEWQPGDIVAVDALFDIDPVTGLSLCLGVLDKSRSVDFYNADGCLTCTGSWILRSRGTPMGGGAEMGAAEAARNCDLRGVNIRTQPAPTWADYIDDSSSTTLGRFGTGFVRHGQTTLDDVLSDQMGSAVSIDPMGAFGQVLGFVNTNEREQEDFDLFFDATATLPRAVATSADQPNPGDPESRVLVAWDCYVQDVNTRVVHRIEGEDGVVASVRLAGASPAGDGAPAGEISFEIDNPMMGGFPPPPPFAWQSTGVATPLNQWFRLRLTLDAEGNWELGMNTLGEPGGPTSPFGNRDIDAFFDHNLTDAHPDALFLASGTSRDMDSMGAPVHDVQTLTFLQGLDDAGDGEVEPAPVVVRGLAPDEPRPVGSGRFDFCFYQMRSMESGATGPLVAVVDPFTGAAIDEEPPAGYMGDEEIVNPNDQVVVAVKFDASAGAPDFGECPSRLGVTFVDGSMNTVGEGTWRLAGRPDFTEFYTPVPEGGAQNEDAIADGFAYNFGPLGGKPLDPNGTPPPPYRNMLLAEFVEIPPLPAANAEFASKWYADNIKVEARAACDAPCPWDLNGDGAITAGDLAFLLGSWGASGGPPFAPADFNIDGQVNASDLAQLLGAWGPCPCVEGVPGG